MLSYIPRVNVSYISNSSTTHSDRASGQLTDRLYSTMPNLNWRFVYFLSIGLRFVFALSDSYIHPDEHFQTFEDLCSRFFNFTANVPWEFSQQYPIRSYGPLLLLYYPILKIGQYLQLLPLQTWYLARLELMAISWIVTDWCLYRMLPTKQERIKSIFFCLTSYISLVFQSHTFSNSMETVLVVLCVYMINELRFLLHLLEATYKKSEILVLGLAIGACFSLGIFNRVTFPAFFIFPFAIYAKCSWRWKWLPLTSLAAFLVTSFMLVAVDTIIYNDASIIALLQSPLLWSQYVVTPLYNIAYNSSTENLSQHGIHPHTTHLMANLPLMMGPGLLFLFWGFKNKYWRTTPFASAASGLVFLSVAPHQELRFLIPIVPLLCSCFDLTAFLPKTESTPLLVSGLFYAWYAFNTILAFLMGILHQGGVVPAVSHLRDEYYTQGATGLTFVWWRTYSPPTWMLGDVSNITQFSSISDKYHFLEKKNLVVDAMGADYHEIQSCLDSAKTIESQRVFLITPVASFQQYFNSSHFNTTWTYLQHLDMDHLDFSDINSLQPGLGVFEFL